MKEDKGGGWQPAVKSKRKPAPQEEKKSDGGRKNPNITIADDKDGKLKTLLKRLAFFEKVLQAVFKEFDEIADERAREKAILSELEKNEELEFASIFCFKAIGVCLELPIEILEKKAKERGVRAIIPLAWDNLYHILNEFIHDCWDFRLPSNCLKLFARVLARKNQIFEYFKFICIEGNTFFSEEKMPPHKFKVFMDVHDLSRTLSECYPRERRASQKQSYFLDLIGRLSRVVFEISSSIELSKEGLDNLAIIQPRRFYALQNCLECMATLATPNTEYSVLTIEGRQRLVSIDPAADKWFRDLGDSRNASMHKAGLIPTEQLVVHAQNMGRVCHLLVGNEPEMTSKESVDKKVAGEGSEPSMVKMVKKLGVVPALPAPAAPSGAEFKPVKKTDQLKSGKMKAENYPPKKAGEPSDLSTKGLPKKSPGKK